MLCFAIAKLVLIKHMKLLHVYIKSFLFFVTLIPPSPTIGEGVPANIAIAYIYPSKRIDL